VNASAPEVLVLAGPTASGKSALALELAERFDAEIVGADSRQIYRGMPLGTAAPSQAQRARVRHHLVEFLDPHERYSAARYANDARRVIREIHARGKRALVTGGTGFYVRALTGDVELSDVFDPALRDRLARETRLHPSEFLHGWLELRAPARAAQIAPGDRYRVVRALEIALGGGAGNDLRAAPDAGLTFRKVALDVDQAILDGRIEARVDAMLAGGFVEEAERIGAAAVAADAVGYPEALAYLAGYSSTEELRAHLIRSTRRYAKRQRTWFRGEPGMRAVAHHDALETLSRLARELRGWA
jgi:tRNA dimethylallyltransferase